MPRRSPVFTLGAVTALLSLNAHRPIARRGLAPLFLTWGAGMPVSELPLHFMAGQAGALARALRRGPGRRAVMRPTARVRHAAGLALTLVGWGGMTALARETGRSSARLRETLRASLGEGYADEVQLPDLGDRDQLEFRPAPSGIVRVAAIRRRYAHDVEVTYASDIARAKLDIWRRVDVPRGARRPVLLQIHGGGWMLGDKRPQAYPLLSHLAELGWVCASIAYPLSPRATWPDHIVAVKRAIHWAKEHIAEYGGDPGFVAVSGGSAGGHLAALAALTANDPHFQPGFETADTGVQAAAVLYGVYDWRNLDGGYSLLQPYVERQVTKSDPGRDPELFTAASPIARIHPDAPPFFVLHGANDSLVPVAGARAFAAALHAESPSPAAYAEFPLTQHGFDVIGSVRSRACAVAVGDFLGVAYGRWKAGR